MNIGLPSWRDDALESSMERTAPTMMVKFPTEEHANSACLVYIYPVSPEIGQRHRLNGEPLMMGREPECQIVLNDSSVSRKHARLEHVAEGYVVEDLGSTNGTFINDKQVNRGLLRDGDYLRVGGLIFRYLSGGNVEAEYHEVIHRLTIVDALTELYNKRFLLEYLDRELVRSQRFKQPLSIAMLDLDRFKAINDKMGHLAGDYTLREAAARLKATMRREELAARYGGEEFTAVLPQTGADGALRFAERARLAILKQPFVFGDFSFSITISAGVATTYREEGVTVEQLLQRADAKLYQAKAAGRNRVMS